MNETLTDRQIAFIIFATVLGAGYVYIPKIATENAGTGSWITIIFSSLIAIVFTLVFVYLGYVHKNKTLFEYSKLLIGKFVTYIFMFMYIGYFFSFFSIYSRIFCEELKIFIMPNTPLYALDILLLFVIYLVLSKRIRALARLCELYGIIIIIGLAALSIIIFSQGEIFNIRPFIDITDFSVYFKAIPATLLPFLGFEILGTVPFEYKNTKKIFRYCALIILIIGSLFIFISESCMSVIGPDDIVHYDLALFATLRSIDVPFLDFLRRLDGIAIITWFMSVFCHLSLFAYGSIFFINKCFEKLQYKFIVPTVLLLSMIVFGMPKTYMQAKNALDYIGYMALLTSFFIPALLLIITKVKKYDKNME